MPQADVGGDGPIFLAGLDRSGIGLLGEILECHPDVSMTRRTNFWGSWVDQFGDLGEERNLERCLDAMRRDRRLSTLDPDVRQVRDELYAGPPTYERLFEILQRNLMERRGCHRWGDKSLGAERHAETILSSYPSAKMVHVLRDPRDRYASEHHHRGPVRGGVGAAAALWNGSEALARSSSGAFGGRHLIVRYEDLVAEPEVSLERIRGFLDLDEPSWEDDQRPDVVPLHRNSVGRHRSDISSMDQRFLALVCGEGMRRWGYQTEPSTMSRWAALVFWSVFVPAHVLSGFGWRAVNAMRQHGLMGPRGGRRANREVEGSDSS